jgi:hypothetical protein
MLEWLESGVHDSAFEVAALDLHHRTKIRLGERISTAQRVAWGQPCLSGVMPLLPGVLLLLKKSPCAGPA